MNFILTVVYYRFIGCYHILTGDYCNSEDYWYVRLAICYVFTDCRYIMQTVVTISQVVLCFDKRLL